MIFFLDGYDGEGFDTGGGIDAGGAVLYMVIFRWVGP